MGVDPHRVLQQPRSVDRIPRFRVDLPLGHLPSTRMKTLA